LKIFGDETVRACDEHNGDNPIKSRNEIERAAAARGQRFDCRVNRRGRAGACDAASVRVRIAGRSDIDARDLESRCRARNQVSDGQTGCHRGPAMGTHIRHLLLVANSVSAGKNFAGFLNQMT
jgi:hypothetical protein